MSGSGHVTSTGHSNCPARGAPRRGNPNCPALLDDDLLREMSRNCLLCSTMGCEEAEPQLLALLDDGLRRGCWRVPGRGRCDRHAPLDDGLRSDGLQTR